MSKTLTKKQMEECLTAQQGELDAVYLYEKLAKRVKDEADKIAFTRLAGDEARHAEVFRKYTNKELKPKITKGLVVPLMYSVLGKKKVYPVIAKAEYDAADKYKHLLSDFPEVKAVMNDEVHHGDAVKGLL
ncbi:MAG: rubrerythrin [Oscillospiraceae bacterium]|nr:rubrerythrin [Oscillospiraceae bacterium]